ncbi:MAG: 4-(cytidine 5'-diphospho)-2-C-methyl-D-erythritol kinase [Tannerella sp.]|jgi:4-diphosphocytidyl-2-C-methyl-D-erythritol kinase|nr:4-(cytidine 5'-diphospho)-2-C-methyl-D-erythritol kinase [Tannerella sp.]
MICFPNAKINLGLHITGKRADGYHDIETLFYPIPLKDALEVVPAPVVSFQSSGIPLNATPEDNLVRKAYRLLNDKYPLPPSAMYLRKQIPFGAGLGGGSADAAFTLKLLNTYAGLHLSDRELETLAATLGADCSFFIRNRPVIASGIGTVFEPVDLSLKGYTLCLVKPEASVSTKEAYAAVKSALPARPLKEIAAMPVSEWKHHMVNDFEPNVFRKYPVIREIKEQLYAQGAVYAAMSGSGSAVFGLFEQEAHVRFPDCFVWNGLPE